MQNERNTFSAFRYFWLVASAALTWLIGYMDERIEPDLSLYVLYAIPIFLASWFYGLVAGLIVSWLAALRWFMVDAVHQPYPLRVHLYWNMLARAIFFSAISIVLVKLNTSLRREKFLARTDYLTGLANRLTFFEFGKHEIERARRYKRPFSIVFLDLDNFKGVNDRLGHDEGDRLLRVVAETLRANIRASDLVARLGGDEFGMLLRETDPKTAKSIVEKLSERLTSAMQTKDWQVTFSIGIGTYSEPPQSVEEMIHHADRLMYEAKKSGKNMVRLETF